MAIRLNAAAFVLFEDPDTDKIPAFFCRGEHAVINELAVSLHRDARSFPEHGSPASGRPPVYKDILPRYELLRLISCEAQDKGQHGVQPFRGDGSLADLEGRSDGALCRRNFLRRWLLRNHCLLS